LHTRDGDGHADISISSGECTDEMICTALVDSCIEDKPVDGTWNADKLRDEEFRVELPSMALPGGYGYCCE